VFSQEAANLGVTAALDWVSHGTRVRPTQSPIPVSDAPLSRAATEELIPLFTGVGKRRARLAELAENPEPAGREVLTTGALADAI
jgi:hypothetical protein